MTVPYKEWNEVEGKQQWGNGPWIGEPDRVQWQDKASGFACLAVRNPSSGNWCGYVGVDDKHPLFGVRYQNVDDQLDVHGGLTYSSKCTGRICHEVPDDEEVWWLGFDCGHAFDFQPGMMATLKRDIPDYMQKYGRVLTNGDVYRTLVYVKQQCAQLAQQLMRREGWIVSSRAEEIDEHIESMKQRLADDPALKGEVISVLTEARRLCNDDEVKP